jgi:hypothetical protein
MNMEPNNQKTSIDLDILKRVEDLSGKLNNAMANHSKSAFNRYPISFTLLVLVGATAVNEGLKDLLTSLNVFQGHPAYLLVFGLVVLILTGSFYKKLNK